MFLIVFGFFRFFKKKIHRFFFFLEKNFLFIFSCVFFFACVLFIFPHFAPLFFFFFKGTGRVTRVDQPTIVECRV